MENKAAGGRITGGLLVEDNGCCKIKVFVLFQGLPSHSPLKKAVCSVSWTLLLGTFSWSTTRRIKNNWVFLIFNLFSAKKINKKKRFQQRSDKNPEIFVLNLSPSNFSHFLDKQYKKFNHNLLIKCSKLFGKGRKREGQCPDNYWVLLHYSFLKILIF